MQNAFGQGRTGHCHFLWNLKDIFRGIEAFFNISILFESIFREIEVFFKVM
jgi:hypothetical protein